MTDEEIRQELRKKKKRKMAMRRLIAAVAATAIFVTAACFAGRAIGSAKYEKELSRFVSVTDETPLVHAAVQEIGNKGGSKYWKWFGFGERVDWCAIFVSWCESQCGYIDDGKAPSFSMVNDGANWFQKHDQWLEKDAVPEAGDLIFFDWEHDGDRDHVGIVTAVKDGMIFTVEGNSSDRCRRKRYTQDNPFILGYARIKK